MDIPKSLLYENSSAADRYMRLEWMRLSTQLCEIDGSKNQAEYESVCNQIKPLIEALSIPIGNIFHLKPTVLKDGQKKRITRELDLSLISPWNYRTTVQKAWITLGFHEESGNPIVKENNSGELVLYNCYQKVAEAILSGKKSMIVEFRYNDL